MVGIIWALHLVSAYLQMRVLSLLTSSCSSVAVQAVRLRLLGMVESAIHMLAVARAEDLHVIVDGSHQYVSSRWIRSVADNHIQDFRTQETTFSHKIRL